MQIVVLDGYTLNPGDLSWDELKRYGELTVYERTSLTDMDEIISRIGTAEIVLTNKTPLSKEIFAACNQVNYVGVLATGYNVVDIDAAREHGVTVCNIPTYGTSAVAQFTIALLLEICHRIGYHSKAVHDGKWENNPDWCFWDYPLTELDGKKMGIIGYGRIGQTTGRIAQALGMKILAYDTFQNPELENENCKYVALDTLFNESDVIALHCPLFDASREMINKTTISTMKDGVIILNTSRGPLIAEQDLADALNAGKVMAAGVDVVSIEPIKGNNPLLTAKNCFITPHIAWAPKESRKRLMDIAVNNLRAYLDGNAINVVSGM